MGKKTRDQIKFIESATHLCPKVQIGKKNVGDGEPCFIIAEIGVNHNGDIGLAKKLIDVARTCGADAVKFQMFRASSLVTRHARKAEYQQKNDPAGTTQFEMLKGLELSESEFKELFMYADRRGILFLSTAFDDVSLNMLKRLDVPAFKIPSGEITNLPYLEKIAYQKRPVILSTGMSTMDEVETAVTLLKKHGCHQIILLHCTTCYPAPLESVNLRVLDTLRTSFQLPVGYSDHTEGFLVPLVAVARGACVIEKHITLDRSLPGPDHAASIDPSGLKTMIETIRIVEKLLGSGEKKPELCEISTREIVRKSVVAAETIPEGTTLKKTMLTLKRPGTGIEPKYLMEILGKRTNRIIKKDAVITWEMIG